MERIAEKIVLKMKSKNLIASDDICEYYIYELTMMLEKWLTVFSVLAISLLFKNVLETVIFLIFFLTLRKHSGGCHSNTFIGCYISSLLVYLAATFFCKVFAKYVFVFWITAIIAGAYIMIIGTVNHPNMHLNHDEITKMKLLSRIKVIISEIILAALVLIKLNNTAIYVSISITLCAISILAAKILKQEVISNG